MKLLSEITMVMAYTGKTGSSRRYVCREGETNRTIGEMYLPAAVLKQMGGPAALRVKVEPARLGDEA